MNWNAIKHIYKNVLVEGAKIKYIEEDKYIITRFHLSGEKCSQTEYKNGLAHGKSLGWFKNGLKEWKIEFKNAKLHGKHTVWNKDGLKLRETEYKNGFLINVGINKQ